MYFSNFCLLSLLENVWNDTPTHSPLKDQWEGFLGGWLVTEAGDSYLTRLSSTFIPVTSLPLLELTCIY